MRLRVLYSAVTVAMLFSLCLALEPKAYAYIDPGSGLLMLQAAGTILTGILFTLRRRIKTLFSLNRPEPPLPIDAILPESEA